MQINKKTIETIKQTAAAALLIFIFFSIIYSEAAESKIPFIAVVTPETVTAGVTNITITGTNLTKNVNFFGADGKDYKTAGSVNGKKTQTTALVPADLPEGIANVKVYVNANNSSNEKLIRVEGLSAPTPAPPAPGTGNTSGKVVEVLKGWKGTLAYNPDKNNWLVAVRHRPTESVNARVIENDGSGGQSIKLNRQNDIIVLPKAVYSPDIKKYLVVYQQAFGTPSSSRNPGDLYGQFLTDTGQLHGSEFRITKITGSAVIDSNARLQYDSTNKQFVLPYIQRASNQVRLLTIGLDGNVKLDVVVSASQPTGQDAPSVAIGPNNELCVVWSVGHPTLQLISKIQARNIDALTGEMGQVMGLSVSNEGYSSYLTYTPNVEYSPDAGKYLAIWRSNEKYGISKGTIGRMFDSCSDQPSTSEFVIDSQIHTASLVYNQKSKVFGIIGEVTVPANNSTGNGEQNETVFVGNNQSVYDGDRIFTDFDEIGNKNPVIAANTFDGTFAAVSSKDYAKLRFASGLFSSSIPPVCNPLPEDLPGLAECNFWDAITPDFPPKPEGTNPANPVIMPAMGTWGISADYNPQDDSFMVVAHTRSGGDDSIVVFKVNAKDMSVISSAVKVDLGPANRFAGSPKIVYDSDSKKFLAAWEDERLGLNRRHIFARFISSNGIPEGDDFPVVTSMDAFLSDLDFDPINKSFVVTYEPGGKGIFVKIISQRADVGEGKSLPTQGFEYRGQPNLTVQTDSNEYLVVFVGCNQPDKSNEDCRIPYLRLNSKTFEAKGPSIQLNNTRVGRNIFAQPKIAYSTNEKISVVIWQERGKINGEIAGIYGHSIDPEGIIGPEFPVLTVSNGYSDQYGNHQLSYNQWTKTFIATAGDNDGGVGLSEFESSGYVWEIKQIIAPPQFSANKIYKILAFLIKQANAAAYGNYNPTSAISPWGAGVFASRNLSSINAVSFRSLNGTANTPTVQPAQQITLLSGSQTPLNTAELAAKINQIYTWALGAASLLALLMITLGGYSIMTSQGNAQQTTKGKEYVYSAIIGLILLFSSYLLLRTINPDLVNFPSTIQIQR